MKWVAVQMKPEGRDSMSIKAGEGHVAILLCSFFKCTFEIFITCSFFFVIKERVLLDLKKVGLQIQFLSAFLIVLFNKQDCFIFMHQCLLNSL